MFFDVTFPYLCGKVPTALFVRLVDEGLTDRIQHTLVRVFHHAHPPPPLPYSETPAPFLPYAYVLGLGEQDDEEVKTLQKKYSAIEAFLKQVKEANDAGEAGWQPQCLTVPDVQEMQGCGSSIA